MPLNTADVPVTLPRKVLEPSPVNAKAAVVSSCGAASERKNVFTDPFTLLIPTFAVGFAAVEVERPKVDVAAVVKVIVPFAFAVMESIGPEVAKVKAGPTPVILWAIMVEVAAVEQPAQVSVKSLDNAPPRLAAVRHR